MTRLAIFTTHPIQYQAPWFRALSAHPAIEVKIFFSYLPNEQEQGVGFGRALRWDVPLLDGYDWRVLKCIRTPSLLPAFVRRTAYGIRRELKSFKADAALILGWQELSLVQALLACRSMGIPVILRGESNALRNRPWYATAIHRRMFSGCGHFLAIGKSNAEFYRAAGVPPERISVAPYFVDNERFRSEGERLRGKRQQFRRRWGIAEEALCFAFVGKLEPKKRVLDFLDALSLAGAQNPNISGLIVGSGEQMTLAKEHARKSSLKISFAGFLNQTEMPEAYVAADAIVLPSDYGETWGLVVNEAMATGLPAIVSDRVGCANDLVIERQTGSIFPFGDTRELAKRILDWARDGTHLEELGRNARQRALTAYSLTNAVDRTVEAIVAVRSARS